MSPDRRLTVRAAFLFLAALSVLARLPGLNDPLLEKWSWRVCHTTQRAFWYFAEDFDPFTPRIYSNGVGRLGVEGDGEFPLASLVVAAGWRVMGDSPEWWARLSSMLVFAFGCLGMWRLIAVVWSGEPRKRRDLIAALALGVLCFFPTPMVFSRLCMPDLYAWSFTPWALVSFWRWRQRTLGDLAGASRALLAAACFGALALLGKPVAVVIGLPILWAGLTTLGARFLFKPKVWAAGAIILVPTVLWMRRASHLASFGTSMGGGIFEGGGKLLSLDDLGDIDFYLTVLGDLHRHFFYTGALALWGLIVTWRDERLRYIRWWLLSQVLLLLLLSRGVRAHSYYSLGMLYPGAIFWAAGAWKLHERFAARLLERRGKDEGGRMKDERGAGFFSSFLIPPSSFILPLALALVGMGAFQRTVGNEKKHREMQDMRALVVELDARAQAGESVVTFHDGGPEVLFSARRKGWTPPHGLLNPAQWRRSLEDGEDWRPGSPLPRDFLEGPNRLDEWRALWWEQGARWFATTRVQVPGRDTAEFGVPVEVLEHLIEPADFAEYFEKFDGHWRLRVPSKGPEERVLVGRLRGENAQRGRTRAR